MSEQIRQQLQTIYDLIKSGRTQEARNALQPILTAPDSTENFEAWWLSAIIAHATNEKREALYKVLKAKPDHLGARQMLDALETQESNVKTKSDTKPKRPGTTANGGRPPLSSIVTSAPPDWLDPTYNPHYQPGAGPRKKKKNSSSRVSLPAFLLLVVAVAFTSAAIGFAITYYRFRDNADALRRQNLLLTQAARIGPPAQLIDVASNYRALEVKSEDWQDGDLSLFGQDLWHYHAAESGVIQLKVNSSTDSLTPIVGLYNAQYKLLISPREYNGKQKSLSYKLPEAGDYYVLVTGLGGTVGTYQLQITRSTLSGTVTPGKTF